MIIILLYAIIGCVLRTHYHIIGVCRMYWYIDLLVTIQYLIVTYRTLDCLLNVPSHKHSTIILLYLTKYYISHH